MDPYYDVNDFAMDAMNEIVPNLWLGSLRAAQNTENLRRKNIHSVLSIIKGRVSIAETFNRLQISLDDTDEEDILQHLITCIAFIQAELDNGRGILVHCLAGISRSTSIVAAYLMYSRELNFQDALALIRQVRSAAEPNEGFVKQLEIFQKASFRVSKHDRSIRMFYLERMVKSMKNGEILLDEAVLVSYPPNPADTTTAISSNRRIRCKMCRQDLASREHMVDHGQMSSPTPAVSYSPTIPFSPPVASLSDVPTFEKDSSSDEAEFKEAVELGRSFSTQVTESENSTSRSPTKVIPNLSGIRRQSVPTSNTRPPVARPTRNTSSVAETTQLGVNSGPGLAHPADLSAQLYSNPKIAALRAGLSVVTAPSPSLNNPRGSPILANPKCSGYFVEPLKWMESFLERGDMSGKIVCPNKKCGAKLGNYDWAGVCCSCKEWVVPGFCIHRSKVDEIA